MLIFDRYLLRIFAKVILVSFVSMTGLYIVIDLFGNLEEFITYAERNGSLLAVISDYYGPRVLSFFDRISGLLALIATIFAITWFQRMNELTAIMAAGISKARTVRPLIIATIAVAMIAAVSREVALPQVRDKLSRNAQDWLGENAKSFSPRRDRQTGILINGKATIAAQQAIDHPTFRLPRHLSQYGRQLAARMAFYRPPNDDFPGGFLLDGVSQPDNLKDLPPLVDNGKTIIYPPGSADWLNDDQCFVVSNITFGYLAADAAWRQYSSTAELIRALHNPSLDYGADTRVTVHRRVVQPMLDVTLLFLGLPLVMSRSNHNLFVAAARCLLLVGGFYVVVLACQAMGAAVMVSPALAAWLPLLIFAPIAYVAALHRWE